MNESKESDEPQLLGKELVESVNISAMCESFPLRTRVELASGPSTSGFNYTRSLGPNADKKPIPNEYDPRNTSLSKKITVFISASLLVILNTIAYEAPGSSESTREDIDNDFNYSLLYSVCNFTNIFLPFLFICFLHKKGARNSLLISSAIVAIAQFFSRFYVNPAFVIVFRAIYGLGWEALNLSQCILLRKWINGNLQLVLTLNLVIFERLGAFSANLLQSYPITQYFFCKVNSAFCFSLCLSCLLIILAFLVFWIDKNADENENQLDFPESVKLLHVSNFYFSFWIIISIFALISIAVFSFSTVALNVLTEYKEKYLIEKPATFLLSLSALPILFSLLIVLKKKIITLSIFITSGSLLILGGHLWLLFSLATGNENNEDLQYYLSFALIGLGFSFIAPCIWPAIQVSTNKQFLILGLYIGVAFKNYGLTLSSFITGLLFFEEKSSKIWPLNVFFIIVSALAFILSLFLLCVSVSGRNRLFQTNASRIDYEAKYSSIKMGGSKLSYQKMTEERKFNSQNS